MILGNYPCCDELLMLDVEGHKLPAYIKEDCPHCGKTVWHKLSRIDPSSWVEENFLKEFRIHEGKIQELMK